MDEHKFVAISGIVKELITIHWHVLLKGDSSVEDKLEYIAGFWIWISTWAFYGELGALARLPRVSVVYFRGLGHLLQQSKRPCQIGFVRRPRKQSYVSWNFFVVPLDKHISRA
jgi:hypothetical protein